MRIGVPREIKDGERRVGLLPRGARLLSADGHEVFVEQGAGAAVGIDDEAYATAGATTVSHASDIWRCELVVKVKEIQAQEFPLLQRGTIVFGYAQLTRDSRLVDAVLDAGVTIVAYEMVRDASAALPLLAPMSKIAGRLAPFVGAEALYTDRGGAGVLMTGVNGVDAANVVVIGAGTAGREAALVAARFGCRVTLLSRGAQRLRQVERLLSQMGTPADARTIDAIGPDGFAAALAHADLVVGAVLDPGKPSPKLITRQHLRSMRRGSAFVDIGIDQGGIAESSRMTTLSAPTYVDEGIVHYAVPNMPSLVARTATEALTAATLPYVRRFAQLGLASAMDEDAGLANGVLVRDGAIVDPSLAAAYASHANDMTAR